MKQNLQETAKKLETKNTRLYTLEVLLIQGHVTEAFANQSPKVSRTIQILGNQSLDALHLAIFYAFGRDDEHMYEFQFGKRPMARDGVRYQCESPLDSHFGDDGVDDPAVGSTSVSIRALGLRVRRTFFYWFDFGDSWWHKIKVVSIQDEFPKKRYPIVTKQVGASPPQYPDWDEEDE